MNPYDDDTVEKLKLSNVTASEAIASALALFAVFVDKLNISLISIFHLTSVDTWRYINSLPRAACAIFFSVPPFQPFNRE